MGMAMRSWRWCTKSRRQRQEWIATRESPQPKTKYPSKTTSQSEGEVRSYIKTTMPRAIRKPRHGRQGGRSQHHTTPQHKPKRILITAQKGKNCVTASPRKNLDIQSVLPVAKYDRQPWLLNVAQAFSERRIKRSETCVKLYFNLPERPWSCTPRRTAS